MQAVTTIGLDIAKSVFQIHGVDAAGNVIVRRQLKRRYVLPFFQKLPPCLVGIEACASSHHWSRELQAIGHTVRLMPPAYVKPYVKRHKNDAADAEAICEAVTRANMRFVATKTPEQQSCLMLHRIRHLFIRHQTSVINAIRAHLAEFGIVAPVGRNGGCGQFRPASTSRRTMTHRYSIRSNSQQMPPEGGPEMMDDAETAVS
jgi:transposase